MRRRSPSPARIDAVAMSNAFLDYEDASLSTSTRGPIPQYVVDEIRDALPPSAVISRYVQLRKPGREWKGLSPFNKERTPSFFVNDEKRMWHDFSSDQGGDVFDFLMKMEGMTFREAAQRCAEMAGISIPNIGTVRAIISPEAMVMAAAEREERRRAELQEKAERERRMGNLAKAIAGGSCAFRLGDGSPPALFLESRGLLMPAHMSPRALLFHSACPYNNDGDEITAPSLIGIYRDIGTDKVKAISRRPLTPEGRSLSKPISLGPTRGCAIKLSADEDITYGLHLAEGITSALGAAMLGLVPIWAAGGTGNIRTFPVLAGIDALTITADHDASGAGQEAANECFARWSDAGREAFIILPDAVGADMADVATDGCRLA
jgi:hypothetical protein